LARVWTRPIIGSIPKLRYFAVPSQGKPHKFRQIPIPKGLTTGVHHNAEDVITITQRHSAKPGQQAEQRRPVVRAEALEPLPAQHGRPRGSDRLTVVVRPCPHLVPCWSDDLEPEDGFEHSVP